jgi:hypothetical protein
MGCCEGRNTLDANINLQLKHIYNPMGQNNNTLNNREDNRAVYKGEPEQFKIFKNVK